MTRNAHRVLKAHPPIIRLPRLLPCSGLPLHTANQRQQCMLTTTPPMPSCFHPSLPLLPMAAAAAAQPAQLQAATQWPLAHPLPLRHPPLLPLPPPLVAVVAPPVEAQAAEPELCHVPLPAGALAAVLARRVEAPQPLQPPPNSARRRSSSSSISNNNTKLVLTVPASQRLRS